MNTPICISIPPSEKQLEYYADFIDLESDEIFGEDENDRSNYIISDNSSEYSDEKVVSKSEDNIHAASQATRLYTKDIHCVTG